MGGVGERGNREEEEDRRKNPLSCRLSALDPPPSPLEGPVEMAWHLGIHWILSSIRNLFIYQNSSNLSRSR